MKWTHTGAISQFHARKRDGDAARRAWREGV